MSEPKYRDWILETIDSLRSRKARPDLERICRMVRRRYGSDPDRTRSELEKLIQEQTVLKVSYKGSISYRNAAKVHRKSRKKPEALGEQTKHAGGTHGPAGAEETGCPTEPPEPKRCCDLQPNILAIPGQKEGTPAVPASGNGCLGCGAAVCRSQARCTAGALRDKKTAPAGGSATAAGRDRCTGSSNGSDAPGRIRASRGLEGGSSGQGGSADKERRTCTLTNSSHLLRRKKQASLKPKLRVGRRATPDAGSPDLGDRLVASVRSLAEKNRGAITRGHPPLGLKEILGFLGSQERLSQEKLTRSKVRAVLEREVAKGRLRRTRFGNITLPMRGVGAKPKPPARMLKGALQERHTQAAQKVALKVEEPMELNSSQQKQEEKEEHHEEAQAGGDGGPLSPDEGDGGAAPGQALGSPQPPHPDTAGHNPRPCTDAAPTQVERPPPLCSTPPPSSTASKQEEYGLEICPSDLCPEEARTEPPADTGGPQGGQSPQPASPLAPGEEEGTEGRVVTPVPMASDAQGAALADGGSVSPPRSAQACSGCRVETGVASCLLTPTASPPESGAVEERTVNGAVLVKMEKSSQNLVEWTVADVASYFIAAGFPEQAAAFRTQEIDGKSLLLMQRNDVLTGLSIRLGPALKIYERHIKVLQRTHFQDESALC
ncbi:sterile alpha motif domain-containing protein 1 isoform X2 [Brienomyrus brachyistius]|uniref:sterile alpha motif domain-containing protein 1 isoform X2 n=1 Tax=Brienomyrus brachyistius TaxID=42636 RepID=UPI0020B220AB|nr:sterile alpha motif domain-containing protein 1 isoform X2 [Brienomyrus brachyistius]